jgi:hypothetical protein
MIARRQLRERQSAPDGEGSRLTHPAQIIAASHETPLRRTACASGRSATGKPAGQSRTFRLHSPAGRPAGLFFVIDPISKAVINR